ncbi:hypothetical protein Poli38472_007452 [Pythium oligandrum]|uniref:Uncharacterized protein n=1 Tax=Pythium oligandrum TaxID=41045 RepID=A0A8K1CQP8_PYTOL|nr:hypothetical protein Poli38472_007452 [Pythium oligandrum]|eukprot:TMW67780.1 hypothetical protein Poli38472_007452 [Pythium oligandrum]
MTHIGTSTSEAEGIQEVRKSSESTATEKEEGQKLSEEVTEYERKRRENIQRNLEFMRSMGVSTAKVAVRIATCESQRKPPPALPKKRKKAAPTEPQRQSRRLKGETTNLMLPENWRDDSEYY